MQPLFLFLGLPGGSEVLIFLFVILLLFGHRLPSVMRSMGQGITEFKRGLRDEPPPDTAPRLPQDENSV